MVKIILLIKHQYSVVFEYVHMLVWYFSQGFVAFFKQVLYLGKEVLQLNFLQVLYVLGERVEVKERGYFSEVLQLIFFTGAALRKGLRSRKGGNILRNCSQIFTDAVLCKGFGLRKGGGGMGEVDSFHVQYSYPSCLIFSYVEVI